MLMAKDQTDDDIVYGKVGKNRSGKSGVSINFKVAFDRYKFLSATPLVNVKKADSTQNAPMSFTGCEIWETNWLFQLKKIEQNKNVYYDVKR